MCHFDNGGVFGTVHLLQRRRNSAKTKLGVKLDGLDELPGDDEYGLCVTDYPADFNTVDPCAEAIVGDVYNPEGIDRMIPGYTMRCRNNHTECAVGDLSIRHGLRPLEGNDTGTLVEYRDRNLNLYGPNTVVGRAMILKRLDTNQTLSCCNIEMPTNARILRADFDGAYQGEITITLPQYDYFDYTKNENTIIMVDLERIDGGPANIPMLGWQLQRGYADETCSRLDPILGQQSAILPGDPGEDCSQTNHRECRLGDLTAKCGPLQLMNNRIRTQCTDNQLGLTSFSTMNQLVVSITDQSNTILDCAQLNEQLSAGGYVDFRFGRGGYTNLVFSQLSQYDPTMYRTYVIGLNKMAGNIVVYDGPDCSNLGNVLDYVGNLPEANPITSDQYPVGELGPKMGGIIGKDYLRTQGLSSNIPLSGPVNILNKPIAVLFLNGSVWGCGMVQDFHNMPYNPPSDIFDYLDLWKPPATSSP